MKNNNKKKIPTIIPLVYGYWILMSNMYICWQEQPGAYIGQHLPAIPSTEGLP